MKQKKEKIPSTPGFELQVTQLISHVYDHCKNVTGSAKLDLKADPNSTSLESCTLTYEINLYCFKSWSYYTPNIALLLGLICDQACENRACGLSKFDHFSNFWIS